MAWEWDKAMMVLHSGWALPTALALGSGAWVVRLTRRWTLRRREERRATLELEAYARLELRLPEGGDLASVAKRILRLVVEVSAFQQAALLTQARSGGLTVATQVNLGPALLEALRVWGEQTIPVGPRLSRDMGAARSGDSSGRRNRSGVRLAHPVKAWTPRIGLEWGGEQVTLAPLWTTAGRMIGAIAVCGKAPARAMLGVEALAAKLARIAENAALAERLLKSEKLAGLGQLAGGVAHALNNPLTAVMGYAELIAETTDEPRVRQDAATILREAERMRATVQSLLDLWRPAQLIDQPIQLTDLVRELAGICDATLRERGVRLVIEMGDTVSEVRGSRDRLRRVLEHLLNNAAQAIANAPLAEVDAEHFIRVTVREDERGVQVIVSDSGPGFAEPAHVFDPFYTAQHPGQGAGLGLSVCYGIVREHGGQISAYNLHPQGAAVVVELPVRMAAAPEPVLAG